MRAILVAIISALIASPALAQQLSVAPVLIDAPANGGPASLQISSTLERPVSLQVRIYDWTQDEGADQLTPSRDVRFSPEIFSLEPGHTQIVRMQVPDTAGTGHWRVIVDELPAMGPQLISAGDAQLQIRLRYVISMFAAETGSVDSLHLEPAGDHLTLTNDGEGYLRLHSLAFRTPDGQADPARRSVNYVLPGATINIPYPNDGVSYSALDFSVGTDTFQKALADSR